MRNRFSLIAVLGVALAAGAGAQTEEYQVKAAFLFNFAKFVEWPVASFSGQHEPIVICILGQNPFGDSLGEAIRGKFLGGRPAALHMISDIPQKSPCKMLFVSAQERARFRSMAGSLKDGGVLTVGEAPWFIEDGGIINLKVESGNVRFEINVEAADQAHLVISSKLLSLAQIVRK